MANQTVNILVVDDDDVDVMMIKRAFDRKRISNPVFFASDGVDALELLRGRGTQSIQRPYLILLDINMPRMNGIEFLDAVRQDDLLRDSVVFVLTTSEDDRDKVAAYRNNVAGYIVKSKAGDGFRHLMNLLDDYWRIVEMPPQTESN